MAFKSRRGAAARREVVVPEQVADVHDDAGVVIRKERTARRTRPARPNVQDDAERPVILNSSGGGFYSNGGLDQLRKEQTRITNTYSGVEKMEVDDTGEASVQIPNEDSIVEAKRKRQQLREAASAPSYIPLQGAPITVAGGVYGPGSGESALVRDDDDDEVPDLLAPPLPKASLSTVIDMIEEDEQDLVGSPVSGATMTISEAEVHMTIVTRLEESRAENAAQTREAAQIAGRLDTLRSECETLTKEIDSAEGKYIGLQDLYATVSSLLECVSGKAPIIDELWNGYCDVRQRSGPRMAEEHDNDRSELMVEAGLSPDAGRRQTEGRIANGHTDVEREAFQLIMEIGGEASKVFADVIDRFSSVNAVLDIFAGWRSSYPDEYESAYCDMSLPRLLAPYVKLILISSGARDPERFTPLLAASAVIREFSPSVMDALDSALIWPFLSGIRQNAR